MNRIASPYLPRAKALVTRFRDEGEIGSSNDAGAKEREAKRQRSPAGWPVERARLASQLEERLNGSSLPNQQGTSYCGCAAFLNCLLEDRPDWYVAYATALWRGEPFTFRSADEYTQIIVTERTKNVLNVI